MAFIEKAREVIDKGIDFSKGALSKAGNAAKEFGDSSVLKIELQQLKSKREKLVAKLGALALQKFADGAQSVSASEASIKEILDSISAADSEAAEKKRLLDEAAAARQEEKASKQAAKAAAKAEKAAKNSAGKEQNQEEAESDDSGESEPEPSDSE